MRMKLSIMYLFLLCALVTISLSGCAEVPEEVYRHTAVPNMQENAEESNSTIQYDTLENIFLTIDQVKSKSYDNLLFKKQFEINKPEEFGVYTFGGTTDFDVNGLEIIKEYIGTEYDAKFLDPTEKSLKGVYYEDDQGTYCGIGENGFLCYDYKENYFGGNINFNEPLEHINLLQEYEDKEYVTSDGPMKISEAVELANNCATEFYSKYNDLVWEPYMVSIFEDIDKNAHFLIVFSKTYQNSILSYVNARYCPQDINDVENIDKSAIIFLPEIMISNHNQSTYINNQYIIKKLEKKEDYQKIVTFESATNLASQLLSSYKRYEVQYVTLEYQLVDNSDEVAEWYSFNYKDTYSTRAYWVFYLDSTQKEEIVAKVDCITGETSFINNKSMSQ